MTIAGTITDSDAPATQIIVNQMMTVNPAAQSSAFGTSSGFEQIGVQRHYGVNFSNVMYTSTIPEPATMLLAMIGAIGLFGWRTGRPIRRAAC